MRVFKKDESRTVYTVEVRDHRGKAFRASGFTDKSDSRELGARLSALVRSAKLCAPPPPELSRWIENMDSSLRDRLIERGLLPAKASPIVADDLLDKWMAHMIASGTMRESARRQRNRAAAVVNGCGGMDGLSPGAVNALLGKWQAGHGAIGKSTAKGHVVAVKGFTAWAHTTGAIPANPLVNLARPRVTDRDLLVKRDALTPAQQQSLVRATAAAETRWGMPGPDRAEVYALCLASGLRRGEVRALIVADFTADGLRVIGKGGREEIQPIPRAIGAALAKRCKGRDGSERIYNLPNESNMSRMIADDYAEAKIKASHGRSVDFHALRHTYCTQVGASDVPIATAQKLMRHRSPQTTMIYMHHRSRDEAAAMDAMPDLLRGAARGASGMTVDVKSRKKMKGGKATKSQQSAGKSGEKCVE